MKKEKVNINEMIGFVVDSIVDGKCIMGNNYDYALKTYKKYRDYTTLQGVDKDGKCYLLKEKHKPKD